MQFKHQPDLAERPSDPKPFKAILIVDDDRELVEALHWEFADQYFLVDRAYDGREALLKVKAHEYDAIVCDMKMPHLRGDEFYLQAVLTRPSLANRFLFITGFVNDREVHRFLVRHNLPYFVKPVPIRQLIAAVEKIVGRQP